MNQNKKKINFKATNGVASPRTVNLKKFVSYTTK